MREKFGDDDVCGDNAFFQQQFVAFIEQFLNFGVLVTVQEPVKIGGVRQFSEWESDHVTDQRSTFKVPKQFRNACDLLCIFIDQSLKETDQPITRTPYTFAQCLFIGYGLHSKKSVSNFWKNELDLQMRS